MSLFISWTRRLALIAIATVAAATLAGGYAAAEQINKTKKGVAVDGWDVVAYFTQSKPLEGKPEFTVEYKGAKWQFANAEHRDLFKAEPAKYAPQYGGFCAYGVAHGHLPEIDPTAWKILDGKLYLNYSPSVQKKWEADIPGWIAKAEEQWPKISK